MKKLALTLAVLVGTIEVYSLLPPRPPATVQEPPNHYRRGAIHVVTRATVPSGETVPSILDAAGAADLDFVVIADTDSVAARTEGWQGRKDAGGKAVDLMVEVESTTPGGQLVFFHSHTGARSLNAEALGRAAWDHFLGERRIPGAFTAIAHPSHVETPWSRLDRYPDGLEVMNLDSFWHRHWFNGLIGASFTAVLGPFNPFLAASRLIEPFKSDFDAWDGMNALAVGKFGYSAHDSLTRTTLLENWHLRYPSYGDTFRMAVNLVRARRTDDFETSRQLLYRAIREGRIVMALPYLYPAKGAEWWLQCGSRKYYVGDRVPLLPGCEFRFQLPEGFPYAARYRLWSGGTLLKDGALTSDWRHPVKQTGPYRMEVWVHVNTLLHVLVDKELPYLLFNPIHVL